MSIHFTLPIGGKTQELTLQETENSAEKLVSIKGRGYKILGNQEDISIVRSHLAHTGVSEFTDLSSFKASLGSIGSKEKIDSVFHKAIIRNPQSDTLTESSAKSADVEVHVLAKSVSPILGQRFDSSTIDGIVDDLSESIKGLYPDRGIANRCAVHLRENKELYKSFENPETLKEKINTDLYEISHDIHLRMLFLTAEMSKEEDNFSMRAEMISARPGMFSDVGYIHMRGFGPVKASENQRIEEREDASARKAEIASAIKKLKDGHAESVIIDLRQNNGGSPDSVELLCSYFMEENVQLSSIRSRMGEGSETSSFQTLPYTSVPKEHRLLNIPVYILTSSETFSAAEKFANDMQILERGIVIGETTKGGANPGTRPSWGEYLDREGHLRSLDVVIPTGETINLKGKPNWEGIGVKPDQPIAKEDAMKKALELINALKE